MKWLVVSRGSSEVHVRPPLRRAACDAPADGMPTMTA